MPSSGGTQCSFAAESSALRQHAAAHIGRGCQVPGSRGTQCSFAAESSALRQRAAAHIAESGTPMCKNNRKLKHRAEAHMDVVEACLQLEPAQTVSYNLNRITSEYFEAKHDAEPKALTKN